jgi:hypothetical protein
MRVARHQPLNGPLVSPLWSCIAGLEEASVSSCGPRHHDGHELRDPRLTSFRRHHPLLFDRYIEFVAVSLGSDFAQIPLLGFDNQTDGLGAGTV